MVWYGGGSTARENWGRRKHCICSTGCQSGAWKIGGVCDVRQILGAGGRHYGGIRVQN